MAHDAGRVLLDLRDRAQFVGDESAQVIRVIGRIRDDVAHALQPRDQASRLRAVTPLAGCDLEPDRQSERIDRRMDLRGQAAFRAADRVSLKPPF